MTHQKALSFFFTNYDFKNFEATAADQGFVENHVGSQYTTDEQPTIRQVRRMVRELSNHPDICTDYMFDAGGHEGMWRRMEGFRVNLHDRLLMKVTIEMGEDAGTYDVATSTYVPLRAAAERNMGQRYTVDHEGRVADLDYAYMFSQIRNLVSQLSATCVFKVEDNATGLVLTVMPLTQSLIALSQAQTEAEAEQSTGTFIRIVLRHVE